MSNDRKKFISGRVVFVLCAALLNVRPSSIQSGHGREDDEDASGRYDIASSCPSEASNCMVKDSLTGLCQIDTVDEVGCFPGSGDSKRGGYPGKPNNVNVTTTYDKIHHCTSRIHLRWSLPTSGSRYLSGFEVVLMNQENARFCRRIPYLRSKNKTSKPVFEYCIMPRMDDLYHVIIRSLPTNDDVTQDVTQDVIQEIEINKNKENCVVTDDRLPENTTTTFNPPTVEPISKQSIIIVVYILLPVVFILLVVFIVVVIIRLRRRDNIRLLQRLIDTDDHLSRSESFYCTKCAQQRMGSTFSSPSECQCSHSELQTTRLFTGPSDQL